MKNGTSEVQVLDYTQQQHRLFPLLASAYCFFFTGKKLLQRLKDIEERFLTDKPVSKAEVTDIHASSSALKSFTTMVTALALVLRSTSRVKTTVAPVWLVLSSGMRQLEPGTRSRISSQPMPKSSTRCSKSQPPSHRARSGGRGA